MLTISALKKILYPDYLTEEMVYAWAGIKLESLEIPPQIKIDISSVEVQGIESQCYGPVVVMDLSLGPTKTLKDWEAWGVAEYYKDTRKRYGETPIAPKTPIDRFCVVTSGNEIAALASLLEKHNMPPPKGLIGSHLSDERKKRICLMRADIYQVDLTKKILSEKRIKELTENRKGIDITSQTSRLISETWTRYRDLAKHIFAHEPDKPDTMPREVFVPFGSGNFFRGLIRSQLHSVRTPEALRLNHINVLGAEPQDPNSKADKLTAPAKPFLAFSATDIASLVQSGFTGKKTQRFSVQEYFIEAAYEILNILGIQCEYSGAAGLALYLQYYKDHPLDRSEKILIVNTGKGIV